MISTFIADVHVGKLAKLLRMAGFDVLYHASFTMAEIADTAKEQKRIVLTKTASFQGQYPDTDVYRIESSDSIKQCLQVINHFQLKEAFQPFHRCLVCNGVLRSVSKENIISLLPEQTSLYYDEFWQCPDCRRIYWKGPHYTRMLNRLLQLQNG